MPYLCEAWEDSTGEVTATSMSRRFNRRDLADIAWACAVCGNYPRELMVLLYAGLVGPLGKGHDPLYMQSIHKDSGLRVHDVANLIYVQAEIDLRDSTPSWLFPPIFRTAGCNQKLIERFWAIL
jgi:hypothetical protein